MKKLLFIFISSFIFLDISGQPSLRLEPKKNAYQAGDKLYKQQVEYKDPGNVGLRQEWDFSNLNILDEKYLVKYFTPDSDVTKICGLEHKTRYYYRLKQDSLWSLGFENNTTLMNYTKPELKLIFPKANQDVKRAQ